MKVIKKINNNVALCCDKNGKELIAFGSGIGFPKMPYELTDLSKISKTFYGVSGNYIKLLDDIPDEIFIISSKIVDYAQSKLACDMNPNIVFTLADHINFAIERYEKRIAVKMPFSYDIEHLYKKEIEIGKRSIVFINKVKKIHLSKDEATGIALHFINSENITKNNNTIDDEQIIKDLTTIIEKEFDLSINKKGFSYSRFVTHIQYLLKRQQTNISVLSDNGKIYKELIKDYPNTYQCVLKIKDYIVDSLDWELNDEELLYLMLHINRLYYREDCNQ